ncbi:solute carrier organic anion transporter family member 4A1-like [Anneissia japonica]|uniref:solute carrier organic anion transporter family member 4A1-like n=1 Tax=Anneissia japonica TaxID=1529436 RepID=UPI001425B852|nr:solute carrier organic anion transporter family member 4A1-like [Anneissia japonica]
MTSIIDTQTTTLTPEDIAVENAISTTDEKTSSTSEQSTETPKEIQASEDVPENDELTWGWFGFRPSWLQVFNNSKWLLFSLCLFTAVQGMVINGFINVSITTIERRFEMPSRNAGFIASSYDLACAILVLFVTYVGGRGHKPQWLAIGLLIMGTGSLIFALPHFTSGKYVPVVGTASVLCGDPFVDDCDQSTDSKLSNYLYVFIVAQLLHGIGAVPLYTLGTALMDESVTTRQSGLYLGIFYGSSIIGPSIGYLIGGYTLGFYTDFNRENEELEIEPGDPAWVGAWWIGFLVGGVLAFLSAIPLSGFPRELPTTAKIRAEKVSEAHADSKEEKTTQEGFGTSVKDFPKAFMYLITNPTFMFNTIAACSEGLVLSGFATFMPKFVENQFVQTAGRAAALVGIAAVPAAGGGTVLGGYFVKRWDLKVRGKLKFCIFNTAMTIILAFILLVSCPQELVAGINQSYYGNETLAGDQANLTTACNVDCGCVVDSFFPVCGSNNIEYFDPCHAGCKTSIDETTFGDCSCLGLTGSTDLEVKAGKCGTDCSALPGYMVGFFIIMVFNFFSSIPATATTLRCIPDNQRSFGLGVQWIFARVFGTIPGPILFGLAIDASCTMWQYECGNKGSCWLYSNEEMGRNLLLIGVGFKIVSLCSFSTSLLLYKPPPGGEDEDTIEVVDKFSKHDGIDNSVEIHRLE